MSSITTIGMNHMKILTGLKDSRLHNKLAKSKAKKWVNMGTGSSGHSRYGHGLLKDHVAIPYQPLKCNTFQLLIPVTLTGPASHLQKVCNNHQHEQINLNVGIVKGIT